MRFLSEQYNVNGYIFDIASLKTHFFSQVVNLLENLEEYVFWTSDNEKLYYSKQELISLISRFPIHITAKGFFIVDRRFLAAVRTSFSLKCILYFIYFRWPPVVVLTSSYLFNLIWQPIKSTTNGFLFFAHLHNYIVKLVKLTKYLLRCNLQ